jgi:hypothetical protein
MRSGAKLSRLALRCLVDAGCHCGLVPGACPGLRHDKARARLVERLGQLRQARLSRGRVFSMIRLRLGPSCRGVPCGALETQDANRGFGGSLCPFVAASRLRRRRSRYVAGGRVWVNNHKANGRRWMRDAGFIRRIEGRYVAGILLRRMTGVTALCDETSQLKGSPHPLPLSPKGRGGKRAWLIVEVA